MRNKRKIDLLVNILLILTFLLALVLLVRIFGESAGQGLSSQDKAKVSTIERIAKASGVPEIWFRVVIEREGLNGKKAMGMLHPWSGLRHKKAKEIMAKAKVRNTIINYQMCGFASRWREILNKCGDTNFRCMAQSYNFPYWRSYQHKLSRSYKRRIERGGEK